MRAGVVSESRGHRRRQREDEVDEGWAGVKCTYIDRDAGDEHDDCEGVEELAPSVDAQRGQSLVRGIHHLTRNAGKARRVAIPHRTIGYGVSAMSASSAQLPIPARHADGGKSTPIRDQHRPGPRSSAFQHPPRDPKPRIAPSETPPRPRTDETAADESGAGIEPQRQESAVDRLFVGKAEAARGFLGEVAGEIQ